MNKIALLLSIILLQSCYDAPKIGEFDSGKWLVALEECNDYRLTSCATLIVNYQSEILGLNQNEIQELFGPPSQHRLFTRNQKFFYYQLDCENSRRLSLRFDALGRVKEMQIEKVSK